MKRQKLFFILLLFLGNMIIYSQCSINAGGNTTICGTSYTLQGSSSGSTGGSPVWSLVSKPSGAPDPGISNVNSLTPNVTGMTFPGNYVFQVTQNCSPSGSVTSQVTINAPGEVSTFTAGPDVTGIPANTGVATLNATVPNGYTASWTYYNIYSYEFSGLFNTTNVTMSNTSTATPTLTLTNKANHEVDPAYRAVLRITSINNPNCWYEDSAIVRFIPNHAGIYPALYTQCVPQGTTGDSFFVDPNAGSPRFSTGTPNSAGNPSFGTTVTMAVVSQPSGGNIQYSRMVNGRLHFSGITTIGDYIFNLTISNSTGTTTTRITYRYNGFTPNLFSFLDAAHPNQMQSYSTTGSGGAVYCSSWIGSSAPITYYFKIDPADPPTATTTAGIAGVIPSGGAPSIVQNGAGTMNRNVVLTPPAGGWRAGTYKISMTVGVSGCSRTQNYYVHISDSARPNVNVNDVTVCYPGSGIVSATIPLPAVYKTTAANPSYFQDFNGRYDITLVSRPAGAALPSYESETFRTLSSTSTVISNLDKQGEYVFRIKAASGASIAPFLDAEYACSGTSLEDTFSIFVSAQVGANAGSTQTVVGSTQTTLNGNNPGASTGTWSLVSKPVGAIDPVIVTPSEYNTNVTSLNSQGTYILRWTVATGTCISTSDLIVNVITATAGGVSGADFWIKSDDAGIIATAWKDHSSNADNIPNVGGMTLSPADRAHNFHPYTTGYTAAKYFNNNMSVMNPTTGTLNNISHSIFSAVRPSSLGNGRITGIDNDANNAAEPGISIAAGAPRHYEFSNTATQTDFTTDFNLGVTNIFSAIANNSTANGGTSTLSGGEKVLGLNGTYATTTYSNTNRFQFVGRVLKVGYGAFNISGAFPGEIMEVIWFKRPLTANEQSRVNSYLAVKNGVTLNEDYLDTASNVVWSRTVNTGYNNNIFGIAKDNITALHQKQAGSINSSQQLVISTTGFADSNVANSTVLANDLQFLMTGDNGLKQNLTIPLSYTTGSNGVTNYRFESIWKVQNTGTVGTVTVAWPKSVKNLYLVQSPDAAFDGADTFTPMTTEVIVNGVVYNTVNVTLANGQFFTFAGFGNAPGGVATNLSYWYRADKNATNTGAGTDVTGWTDIWNGTTVAQLGTNALPKYAVGTSSYFNFNPGINFTGITQTIGNNSVQTIFNANNDLFMVTKEGMTSPSSPNPHILSIGMDNTTTGITNWDYLGIYPNSLVERRVYNGGTNFPGVNPAYSTAIPSIMYYNFLNQPYSRGLNGAANGATYNSLGAMGIPFGGHIFGDTRFSSNGSDNGGFIGNIGETIIYGKGNLTATERRRVDSYLAIKYGITLGQVNTDHYLDANAAIVWNGTTNTTYNNNIFGVAREDIGLFEQKISKSVNAGTILTVATTTNFLNPNQDAARTGFSQDKTYLLLGDNNNTNVALNSITVNSFTGGSRIQRQWLAQPTNAVGTVNFGVELTSYGTGFESSASVKMIVADDVSFTTNVVYVDGTYDGISGKWVHPYAFTSGQNKYITYVTVDETSCTTGCNDNTYLNSVDPNTIEYDNLVASGDAIVAKEKDGSYKIWGYNTGPTSIPSNVNKLNDLLVPTAITPANGFNYTGTPLKVSIAGNSSNNASLLLTTDGLYGWGFRMATYTKTTNNTNPQFGKITIGGKTDGLPPGVSPANVKMLFQSYVSIVITTCKGEAWTMSGYASSSGNTWLYGDGSPVSATSSSVWHRVKTSASETLDNVVAVRGNSTTKFALTSDGKLYTWGASSFIGDGTDPFTGTNRSFATEVTVPNGITPKMIGITEDGSAASGTYFLLATNGKLFAMGSNNYTMLGDSGFSASFSPVWREVTATSGGHTLGGNIEWISPTEEGYTSSPSINVLTNDKKQWGWGSNQDNRLGQSTNPSSGFAPIYMPGNTTNANGMGLNDEIIAVETGGRFTMNYKKSSQYFGFVGATSYGTIGNGSTGNGSHQKYTYDTAIVDACGVSFSVACYKPGITTGITLDTKVGITTLNRAGSDNNDNWPMTRKGGWLALESKTKGFVPNRVAFSGGNPVGIAPANFVEGMMVYDMTNKCMKMYTSTDGGTNYAWYCISTQTCPD